MESSGPADILTFTYRPGSRVACAWPRDRGGSQKWERRDRKLRKRRSQDMVVSNRSIKTVILPTIGKKAQEAKRDNRKANKRDTHDPR